MRRGDRKMQTQELGHTNIQIPAAFSQPAGFLSEHPDHHSERTRGSPQAAARYVEFQATRSGPLPPPETLAKYERLHPGTAERIIRMAEGQAAHRMSMEKAVIEGNVEQQRPGPLYGFVLALITIVGGIGLTSTGHSIAGLTAIIVPIAGLAGVFVYGREKQDEDRHEKKASVALNQEAGSAGSRKEPS